MYGVPGCVSREVCTAGMRWKAVFVYIPGMYRRQNGTSRGGMYRRQKDRNP